MSAFAYCHDCREVTTGVMDLAKGFLLGSETNHIGCTVTYLDPSRLPPPLGVLVARLGVRPESITDNHITLFRLGLDMHDYPTGALEAECPPAPSPALDAASTSTTSPVAAVLSAASTRSPHASRPTSGTPATPSAEPDLLSLLEDVAS